MLAAQIALFKLLTGAFLHLNFFREPYTPYSLDARSTEFGLYAYALCLLAFHIVRIIDVPKVTALVIGGFFVPIIILLARVPSGWVVCAIGFVALALPYGVEMLVRHLIGVRSAAGRHSGLV